jgi:hypothetical protein
MVCQTHIFSPLATPLCTCVHASYSLLLTRTMGLARRVALALLRTMRRLDFVVEAHAHWMVFVAPRVTGVSTGVVLGK